MLIDLQGVVEDERSRMRIAAGLKDILRRRSVSPLLHDLQVTSLVRQHSAAGNRASQRSNWRASRGRIQR